MPPNWKTTASGFLGALGAGLLAAAHYPGAPAVVAPWLGMVGACLLGASASLLGYNATDARKQPSV